MRGYNRSSTTSPTARIPTRVATKEPTTTHVHVGGANFDAEDGSAKSNGSATRYGRALWPGQQAGAQVNHGGHQQRGTTGQGLRQ